MHLFRLATNVRHLGAMGIRIHQEGLFQPILHTWPGAALTKNQPNSDIDDVIDK